MQKVLVVIMLLLVGVTAYIYTKPETAKEGIPIPALPEKEITLYQELELEGVINPDAFEQALTGYFSIHEKSKELLTIIDFTLPSTEERMYVIDMQAKKLLYITHVSHGRNSGENYVTSYSNVKGSFQSSPGFFLTERTYQGKNGYSLVLEGLEKGINCKAKERAVVIHGAPYADPAVIAKSGRLGRSLGCPALPPQISNPVIDTIKEGSVLFIYSGSSDYLSGSTYLHT